MSPVERNYCGYYSAVAKEAKPLLRPDSLYYISKMQHICWQLLIPSGHNTQKTGVEMIFFFFYGVHFSPVVLFNSLIKHL